jgi:hypothetical protein
MMKTNFWLDLDIPEFLRISSEERARAWREWRGWDAKPATPTAPNAMKLELEQRKRAKTRARINKMLAIKAERDAFNSIPKSRRRWDVNLSRFIEDPTT